MMTFAGAYFLGDFHDGSVTGGPVFREPPRILDNL
jgi:hypothetical protein